MTVVTVVCELSLVEHAHNTHPAKAIRRSRRSYEIMDM